MEIRFVNKNMSLEDKYCELIVDVLKLPKNFKFIEKNINHNIMVNESQLQQLKWYSGGYDERMRQSRNYSSVGWVKDTLLLYFNIDVTKQ